MMIDAVSGGAGEWLRTGLLVIVTAQWLVAALWVLAFHLAVADVPEGRVGFANFGRKRGVYLAASFVTLFAVPVGLGGMAYQAGFASWVCMLYLLPHGAGALAGTGRAVIRWRNRWNWRHAWW
jgi:hypothetical protein